MIEIWPSIDLLKRKNVKLDQGNFDSAAEVGMDPEAAVLNFSKNNQVDRIQIIDLAGAKEGQPLEMEYIRYLIAISKKPLVIGGGIRSLETIDSYLELGIEKFVVGTKAVTDFLWLKLVTDLYPDKIYLAIDAVNNEIAFHGWTENSRLTVTDVIAKVNDFKLGGIIYTDITKDGTLLGPNIDMTSEMVKLSKHPIITSGGIRSFDDIHALEEAGVHAVIIGKAAYSETFWE